MLTERIIGALTFRRGVYAEVEADKTFHCDCLDPRGDFCPSQSAWIKRLPEYL